MTNRQLEKLGIVNISDCKFWINTLEIEIKIPKHYSIDEIFQDIWEKAFQQGIEQGKELKVQEIKKCLEIYD